MPAFLAWLDDLKALVGHMLDDMSGCASMHAEMATWEQILAAGPPQQPCQWLHSALGTSLSCLCAQ